jgi:redox-sensitive bicupin YhaK (pirin superfamily)
MLAQPVSTTLSRRAADECVVARCNGGDEVVDGEIEAGGVRHGAGRMLVFRPGPADLQAVTPALLMLLGGEPMDGPRHLWWNFVSSSTERIEQAKADWRAGRFPAVPGESEFIPLPEGPPRPVTYP